MDILQFNLSITLGLKAKKMNHLMCYINLDYDPENEELAVILNNANDFCEKFDLNDIYCNSIKIFINSPEHYYVFEKGIPFAKVIPDTEEDDDEFDIDSDCYCFNDIKWRN